MHEMRNAFERMNERTEIVDWKWKARTSRRRSPMTFLHYLKPVRLQKLTLRAIIWKVSGKLVRLCSLRVLIRKVHWSWVYRSQLWNRRMCECIVRSQRLNTVFCVNEWIQKGDFEFSNNWGVVLFTPQQLNNAEKKRQNDATVS